MNLEIIGTIASGIVLLSFLEKEERKIRVINVFGAGLFVIYGLLTGAFSVWLLNGILILIHGWRLLGKKTGGRNGKCKKSPSAGA